MSFNDLEQKIFDRLCQAMDQRVTEGWTIVAETCGKIKDKTCCAVYALRPADLDDDKIKEVLPEISENQRQDIMIGFDGANWDRSSWYDVGVALRAYAEKQNYIQPKVKKKS